MGLFRLGNNLIIVIIAYISYDINADDGRWKEDCGEIVSDESLNIVYSPALHTGDRVYWQAAADALNEVVIRNDYKIGTGFLSTPFLCEVLTKGGHLYA